MIETKRANQIVETILSGEDPTPAEHRPVFTVSGDEHDLEKYTRSTGLEVESVKDGFTGANLKSLLEEARRLLRSVTDDDSEYLLAVKVDDSNVVVEVIRMPLA